MADTKVSAFPPSAGLVLTDIFPVVDDPGGTPVSQKATLSQLQTLFSSGAGSFVLKAGDTMTGLLTVVTAANSIRAVTSDAGAANKPLTLELFHQTSVAPSAGFGHRLQFSANTATVIDQPQARIETEWLDVTDATRTSSMSFGVRTNAAIDAVLFLAGGQTQVKPGLVGVPGLTFQADLDTGLFNPSANNLGITVAGVQVLNASSTTGIIISTSLTLPYVVKAATYTASAVDYTIDCTSGSFDIDLPTAVGITGRIYVVKNSGVGTITIDPNASETIDGLATSSVVAGGAAMIQSNGANWIII